MQPLERRLARLGGHLFQLAHLGALDDGGLDVDDSAAKVAGKVVDVAGPAAGFFELGEEGPAGFLRSDRADRLNQGEELLVAGILGAELFGGDLQKEGERVLARFVPAPVEENDETIDAVGRAVAFRQQMAPGLEARVDEKSAQAGITVYRGAAQKRLAQIMQQAQKQA